MKKQAVTIENETGLHARPASMIVDEASTYDADVQIVYDGQEVNAKSIMGVMSLGISQDAEIIVQADGDDEEEAVNTIIELIQSGFGEE
ncbi:HPr family phosphocarrier protein [Halanaerobacter jeridensis]|uniref:Phosphocarrier protein HPr n=1 Tax=Halanaerobacter jeridensis TaxID=706427 RepID=A0A938XXR8_9FIRM|nr:HPr family phosphocarrier protein [Halanaerobacter jeridensis]MBM7558221.1 phosphotransferase system HPr (HPr) family protein [Halanaerobacter jeridensis]